MHSRRDRRMKKRNENKNYEQSVNEMKTSFMAINIRKSCYKNKARRNKSNFEMRRESIE